MKKRSKFKSDAFAANHFISLSAGLALETDYSDWNSGEERVIRRWHIPASPVQS